MNPCQQLCFSALGTQSAPSSLPTPRQELREGHEWAGAPGGLVPSTQSALSSIPSPNREAHTQVPPPDAWLWDVQLSLYLTHKMMPLSDPRGGASEPEADDGQDGP